MLSLSQGKQSLSFFLSLLFMSETSFYVNSVTLI